MSAVEIEKSEVKCATLEDQILADPPGHFTFNFAFFPFHQSHQTLNAPGHLSLAPLCVRLREPQPFHHVIVINALVIGPAEIQAKLVDHLRALADPLLPGFL